MGCICSIEEEEIIIKRKKSSIIINTPIFSNDFILHDYIDFSDNNIDKIFSLTTIIPSFSIIHCCNFTFKFFIYFHILCGYIY